MSDIELPEKWEAPLSKWYRSNILDLLDGTDV